MLDLPPQWDVLDIGAGAGEGPRVLAWRRQTGRVVGVDPAPGPGVQAGDAHALPFPDQSFDAALLVRVLAHLQNEAQALTEAWRVLGRPAGERGPDVTLRDSLRAAGHLAERLDVHLPISLTAADAQAIGQSYGLKLRVNPDRFPLSDALHLTAYIVRKP